MATSKQPYGGHVRVRLPNGAESTVGAAYAARHNLTVLEKDALDRNGRPARAKARTEKGDKAGTRKVANDTPATTTGGTTTTKEA